MEPEKEQFLISDRLFDYQRKIIKQFIENLMSERTTSTGFEKFFLTSYEAYDFVGEICFVFYKPELKVSIGPMFHAGMLLDDLVVQIDLETCVVSVIDPDGETVAKREFSLNLA